MNTLVKIQCPYCWEELSIELDPQGEEQNFIEDCHICCRPISIHAEYNINSGDFSVNVDRSH